MIEESEYTRMGPVSDIEQSEGYSAALRPPVNWDWIDEGDEDVHVSNVGANEDLTTDLEDITARKSINRLNSFQGENIPLSSSTPPRHLS